MFAAAMLGILVTMFLALIAALRGPTVFDRILAINMFRYQNRSADRGQRLSRGTA